VTREDLAVRAHKAAQIAEKLRDLAGSEGWAVLREVFTAAESTYYATVTRQLMRGRDIDQRKLDYNRGIFDGVKQLLEQPDKAEAALKRALDRIEAFDAAEKE